MANIAAQWPTFVCIADRLPIGICIRKCIVAHYRDIHPEINQFAEYIYNSVDIAAKLMMANS